MLIIRSIGPHPRSTNISSRPWFHAGRLIIGTLFWPILIMVVWGELTTAANLVFVTFGDKAMHFSAYFLLGAMAAAATKGRRQAIYAVFGLCLLGGILELVQSAVGRNASVMDELANIAGAVSGGALARQIVEKLRRSVIGE